MQPYAVRSLGEQVAGLRDAAGETRAEVSRLRAELAVVHTEAAQLRAELAHSTAAVSALLDRNYWLVHEGTRQRALFEATLEEYLRLTLARIETRQLAASAPGPHVAERPSGNQLRRWEFSVYSQFGEDGILQFLTQAVALPNRRFVEFGVEDYRQANTRLLLAKDRWSGLVLDGDPGHIAKIKADPIYSWRDLSAKAAFITAENINDLLAECGFAGELGVLSIDIDGNDYWVWERLDVVTPAIVVVEYNYRFGPADRAAVPYDPGFMKADAHPTAIYFGASLAALCDLGERKGYAFVGCSAGGVNAFFVRRDLLPPTLRTLTPEEGYEAGQHAEIRCPDGTVRKGMPGEEAALLAALPLHRFGAMEGRVADRSESLEAARFEGVK